MIRIGLILRRRKGEDVALDDEMPFIDFDRLAAIVR